VATDLDTPANRRAARKSNGRVEVRWVDLTDHSATHALVRNISPTAIVHLAAVIPPFCYRYRALARRVNVDATAELISAARALRPAPRFIQASSVAVYGVRNPYRVEDLLTADTAVDPVDNYGGHKVEVETLLAKSDLEWVVLRLGGVMPSEADLRIDKDSLYFQSVLPIDNRIHTVDVRDVGYAFAAAISAKASREVLLIGGDDTHRQRHGDLIPAFTAAIGLKGVRPKGLRGDPSDDSTWFHTDWMDCTRAQSLLGYQQRSWPDMMAELRERAGWKRPLLKMAAPVARLYLGHNALSPRSPGCNAQPWEMIRSKWGEYTPDVTGASS
jgi:nucleoside-diphosphate-sugar epimerase